MRSPRLLPPDPPAAPAPPTSRPADEVTVQAWPGDGMCLLTVWNEEGSPPACLIVPRRVVTDELCGRFMALVRGWDMPAGPPITPGPQLLP